MLGTPTKTLVSLLNINFYTRFKTQSACFVAVQSFFIHFVANKHNLSSLRIDRSHIRMQMQHLFLKYQIQMQMRLTAKT